MARRYNCIDPRVSIIIEVGDTLTSTSHDEPALIARIAELERRAMDSARQLEATANELEAFGSALSHDLRAPLRGIEGFTRLLLEPPYIEQFNPEGKDYLQRIHRASLKLGQMMEDLLQLVRLARGGLKPERVDLSAMAQDIVQALRTMDPERQVRIAIEPDIVVTGDARLLRLALENLLGNAWKFTAKKDDAEISIALTSEEDGTAVCVRDNGAGFDQKYADKLFRPFQRLHSESEFQGMGIGLAKAQRVMLAHGGRIWGRAQRGIGATFCFALPGMASAAGDNGGG